MGLPRPNSPPPPFQFEERLPLLPKILLENLLSLGRIKCTWPNTVGQNFATGVIQWTLVVFVVLGVVLVLIEVVASHYCY